MHFYINPADYQSINELLVGDGPVANRIKIFKQSTDSMWVEVIGKAFFVSSVWPPKRDVTIGAHERRVEGTVKKEEIGLACIEQLSPKETADVIGDVS